MNRVINLTVRLSIKEKELLQEKANKSGRKLATYVRDVALGKKLHEKPSEEFIEELKNIRSIESRINSIIQYALTTGDVNTISLEEVSQKLNTMIDEIRHLYIGGDNSGDN